jgi:MraZ protein
MNSQFLGTHTSKLDAKGRVSIPAPFRHVLSAAGGPKTPLVLRPSHTHPCLEGWSVSGFEALTEPLDRLNVLGEEYEDLAAALFADAHPSEPDAEGRVVLPAALIAHANLTDRAVFMGLGKRFQIWEPVAAEERRIKARASARNVSLPAAPSAGNAP